MPGDPVLALIQARGLRNFPIEVYNQTVRQLGLDDPLIIQYFRFLGELFTGNWGVSISIDRNEPVWDLIMQRLPRTIDLTVFSLFIGAYLGIKLGIKAATHRRETTDTIVRGLSILGVSIPIFFLGMVLQYFFVVLLPIFDPVGHSSAIYSDPPLVTGFYIIDAFMAGEWYKIGDYIWHLVLPVFCLSFVMFSSISRHTRSSMLEELNKDYVRTARAKGCREKDVIKGHALQNALIPTITIAGLTLLVL
jgi:peptide/nickel transport system permease protein